MREKHICLTKKVQPEMCHEMSFESAVPEFDQTVLLQDDMGPFSFLFGFQQFFSLHVGLNLGYKCHQKRQEKKVPKVGAAFVSEAFLLNIYEHVVSFNPKGGNGIPNVPSNGGPCESYEI